MLRTKWLFAALASLLLIAPVTHAQGLLYSVLLSGPAESPPNASPGVGSGFVLLDTTTHLWHLHVDFAGLTGTTTASHIHSATAVPGTGTAGVATTTPTFTGFPLGVTAGTYDVIYDMTLSSSYNPSYVTAHGGTTAQAELDLAASINAGTAYWNIHSSTFPGGEIRGFLAAVPEPATVAMISAVIGGAGLFELRRRLRNRSNRFAKVK